MAYNHILSESSKKVYDTLHSDLQIIISWGLKRCAVDFTLYEGHRSEETQFEYFKKGRELNHRTGEWEIVDRKKVITSIDGKRRKGKHNYNPSLAVDLHVYVPDKPYLTWDEKHLTYIGASLIMVAKFLYEEGLISHTLRWGGNWDRDGDLADNTLYDLPHLELHRP